MKKTIIKSFFVTMLCTALLFGGIAPGVSVGVANAAVFDTVNGKSVEVKIVRDMKNNQSYYIMNPLMLKWYQNFKPGVTKTRIYGKYYERSYPAGATL